MNPNLIQKFGKSNELIFRKGVADKRMDRQKELNS